MSGPVHELASALWHSPTFVPEMVRLGLPLLACLAIGGVILWRWMRRARRRSLHADERGMAVAAEFVLVMPIFLAVMMMTLQFAVLLNGAMVTHYAAYCAARSARVHAWDVPYQNLGTFSALNPFHSIGAPRITPDVRRRALNAARVALIAASPSSESAGPPRRLRWLDALAASSDLGQNAYRETLARKAGWAFNPQNTRLRLVRRSQDIGLPPFFGERVYEIEATLDFEQYIALVPGRIFGRERGGVWVSRTTATVRLL